MREMLAATSRWCARFKRRGGRRGRTRAPGRAGVRVADYPQYHQIALRSGAAGFVAKSVETRELIEAVRAVAAGRLVFDRRQDALPPELTSRELDVVRLVADGLTNDEIGAALGVTTRTVEAHLGRIFERTGASSRTELATRAIREAWLDVPVGR
jgi:DNA-binding NarL/FixJ family response regulator